MLVDWKALDKIMWGAVIKSALRSISLMEWQGKNSLAFGTL